MACDPQELINLIDCIQARIPTGMTDAVIILLLCKIRDEETMSCDPQALIDEASCLFSCIPAGAAAAVKIALLCQIAEAGGGGGGAVQVYQDRAPAAPDDPTKAAISYETATGTASYWNVAGVNWF